MAMKGKLRSSSKVYDLTDEQPLINNNVPQAVIEYEPLDWSTIIWGWAKTIILFLLLGVVLVAGIYAGLSATILYAVSPDKGETFAVARGTYVGGIIPEGATIYVSTTNTVENTFLSNLSEGFGGVKNGAIVKTLAGPAEAISVDTNAKTITLYNDGKVDKTFNGTLPEEYNDITFLKNQYLVECVSGACAAGEYLIINQNQISGEVITSAGK